MAGSTKLKVSLWIDSQLNAQASKAAKPSSKALRAMVIASALGAALGELNFLGSLRLVAWIGLGVLNPSHVVGGLKDRGVGCGFPCALKKNQELKTPKLSIQKHTNHKLNVRLI